MPAFHPHYHEPEIFRLGLSTVLLPGLLAYNEYEHAYEPISHGLRAVSGDRPAAPYQSRCSVK